MFGCADISARSSSAICDGPSSPIDTPACDPAIFTLRSLIASMRTKSPARRQKRREGRRKRNRTACGQAHRGADHALLRDETLIKPIRVRGFESFAERRVLDVGVERDNARVGVSRVWPARVPYASRVAICSPSLKADGAVGRRVRALRSITLLRRSDLDLRVRRSRAPSALRAR